ncbi:hypothetical protein [Streptomyces sp. NPDC017993]|uniref:hypothetical protein n=1 Tax=Streptomyces sp. NPDC017993 TaxID=3365027 RepID=UPI0037BD681E
MSEEKAPFEIIDVSEGKPEEVGTLSLRYVDGTPVLVISGGTVIPAGFTVVDDSGKPVAACAVGPIPEATEAPVAARRHAYDYGTIRLNTDPLFEAPGGAGEVSGG